MAVTQNLLQALRLPTLVLSSGNNISEAVRAMQENAMDFIEKPFVEETLVSSVLDILKLR